MFEKILELMAEKRVNAYQVALATKIPQTYFSAWKTGRCQPSVKMLSTLADYFDVSIDYLLGRTSRRKPYRQ